MAVGAPDLALGHLGGDHVPADVPVQELGDPDNLVSAMIELEDDGVGLAAVHARVGRKVLEHPAFCWLD